MAEKKPANRKRTGNSTSFKPGQSGNPKGRPKQTPEQQDALQAIRNLAPEAAEVLHNMLTGEDVPYPQKLKAAELILERTYGKADARVEVTARDNKIMEEVRRRMAGDAL
jgi:plasmid stability protein